MRSATTVALPLPQIRPDRSVGDRLELLIALINAPWFESAFRADIIRIPPNDPASNDQNLWMVLGEGDAGGRTFPRMI